MLTLPGEKYDERELERIAWQTQGTLVSVTVTGLKIVTSPTSGRTSMIITIYSPEAEAVRNATVGYFKPRGLNLHCTIAVCKA